MASQGYRQVPSRDGDSETASAKGNNLLSSILAESDETLLDVLAVLWARRPHLLEKVKRQTAPSKEAVVTGKPSLNANLPPSVNLIKTTLTSNLPIPTANASLERETTGSTTTRRLRECGLESSQEKIPTVQFSSFIYFCTEDEDSMSVDIMRIGNCEERSEVSFQTRNVSAKAGKTYTAVSTRVVFSPMQDTVSVQVPLVTSEEWDTTVEFAVELSEGEGGAVNAILGKYLWNARVKVIDGDCFPSNKYQEPIMAQKVHDCPKLGLFFEYLKFNWGNPVVRQRTYKYMFIDQLHNWYSFYHLFLNVYLVDYVLNPHSPDERLVLVHSKFDSLLLLVAANLVPFAMLHVGDHLKATKFGVGGNSRIKIQTALIRKFLNYDESVRQRMRNGDLVMGMTRDTTSLVGQGFKGVLEVMKEMGGLILMLVYQFVAPVVFDKPFSWLGFFPLFLFPILMVCFLQFRDEKTSTSLQARSEMTNDLVQAVEETVSNFRLIADYNQREKATDMFVSRVKAFNTSNRNAGTVLGNNKYFAKWLVISCIMAWTLAGGIKVIEGDISLGMFLANVTIFSKIGGAWGNIYGVFLEIHTIFPPMANIVTAMNLETDVPHRMAVSRKGRQLTNEIRHKIKVDQDGSGDGDARWASDRIPIMAGNIVFTYCTEGSKGVRRRTINLSSILEIQQGSLCMLIGPRGGGKSTLLKIIGGAILPNPKDMGDENPARFVIPSHLRVLHVTRPLFFEGTLKDNLLFALKPDEDDASMARVEAICTKLGMTEEMMEQLESEDCHNWGSVFSTTQSQLLSIAMALITNPEVLCIHKPTQLFTEHAARMVTICLKEFVEEKGLEQTGPRGLRRPRTVLMTTTGGRNLHLADRVFAVSNEEGIRRVIENSDMEKHLGHKDSTSILGGDKPKEVDMNTAEDADEANAKQ